jgi:hypothetical protein
VQSDDIAVGDIHLGFVIPDSSDVKRSLDHVASKAGGLLEDMLAAALPQLRARTSGVERLFLDTGKDLSLAEPRRKKAHRT